MARKKQKEKEWAGEITVLNGELAELNRSTDRLMTMMQQADGDKELIDRTAIRVVAAAAERRRIKAINKFVDGKSLVELRMRGGPMATLINGHKIGGEEMMAIMDIELAINALSGGLMFKPVSLELKSAGAKADWSGKVSEAVERYRHWANFWSARAVKGDKTFAIVIAAVIEGRAFRAIEQDCNIGTGRASLVCVRGLRDYAARSAEVVPRIAKQWMDEALLSFKDRSPLAKAVARAIAVKAEERAA
jgi:hypothetical protein